MNHQRKNAAVKKYAEIKEAGATQEEVSAALQSDEKEYSPEEVGEILGTMYKHPGIKESAKSKLPNDVLNLAQFDYKNLKGTSFEAYNGLISTLRENDQYDFELFKATPIMKARFEGMEGTPYDHVGIQLRSDIPEHKTRIPVKVANEYNAQILNAHSRAGHGKYYLLKK